MGLFSSIGGFVNDIFGGTAAGKQSQAYQVQAMKLQNQFQKEFAQNAHQWEAQDLMKAGYNPALTTGLGGASAGGAGGGSGATVQPAATDIIGMLGGIANIYNSTSATKAQNKLALADADLKTAQALKQLMENDVFKKFGEATQMRILNNLIKSGGQIDAQTLLTQAQTSTEGARKGKIIEETNTERSRRGQIDAQTINTIKNTETVDMNNYILQKDVDMLKKYGISRSEIKEIGGGLFKELMGMFRAGKYAEAAKMIKNSKKGK